jgi:hypothetical protein
MGMVGRRCAPGQENGHADFTPCGHVICPSDAARLGETGAKGKRIAATGMAIENDEVDIVTMPCGPQ